MPLALCFFSVSLAAQCGLTVNAGPDVLLCTPPTPTQLSGSISGTYLGFNWTPTTGLQNPTSLNPTVNVTQSTTYTLTATAVDFSTNSIDNGDFESGNSGFSSDYDYSPGDLNPEGFYDITNNPHNDHNNFANCGDHSGSGNMMVVNGAGTPNQDVWCQTIAVQPNTDYVFSCWVTTVVSSSPALLQFFINGSSLGPIFQAPGQNCVWQNFYSSWNSGSASSATICIVNQNTVQAGNDFALDDILFTPVCVQTDEVEVTVVNITAVANPSGPIPACTDPNITLSGDGSSTGADISYEWTTPDGNIVSDETTLNPVVNAPGHYTLYVTYHLGNVTCEKTATVIVGQSTNPLAASIDPPAPFGCGGAATVTLVGHSTEPNASTYEWLALTGNIVSNGELPSISIDQPGQYQLLVTNTTTGCTATATITVGGSTNAPIAEAAAFDVITCANPATTLSSTGSSTGANIHYAWTASGGGTITNGQNSPEADAGSAGTYTLIVTNTTNGCTATATVVVTADITPPALTIQSPGVLDCDTPTMPLSATATPANASLLWTASGGGQLVSGQTTLNPTAATAGTYTLLATNPLNGCTATISTSVTANRVPPLAVVQPAPNLTCQASSVALSATGSSTGANFTYAWSTSAGGNVVSGGTTLNPTVNAAGTYTLLVTNTTTACTATASVTVTSDQNVLTAIANAPDTLTCSATTVQLNSIGTSVGPTILHVWSTTNGNISGPNNIPNPTATLPGTYQLLVTNTVNGCTATDLAVVVQNHTGPQITIAVPSQLSCANPTLSLQGQNGSLPGNFTYQWTTTGGTIVSGATTLAPVIGAAGQYILTATNVATGCTGQATVSVTAQSGTPTAIIVTPSPLTCANPTQTLNTTGSSIGVNFTYAWTVANGGNITTGINSTTPTINAAGTYNLLITNTTTGCSATTSVVISGNTTPPPAEAGAPGMLTCSQPSFSLVANPGLPTGNLVFQWTTTNGQIVGNPNSAQVNASQAGLYHLLVTDPANGCRATDSVQLTANQQLPTVTIAAPAPLSCAQVTTTLSATATGTMLTYQWQTSGGQFVGSTTTAMVVVSAAGLYYLTVTNGSNGCSGTANVTVVQNGNPSNVQAAPVAAITCIAPTQTIIAQNLSLPGNFTYNWVATNGGNITSGNTTLMPTVSAGGDYTLTTTNQANGCTSVLVVSVAQNTTVPTANAGPDKTLSCTANSLIINGSGTGANNLTYVWTATNGGHLVSGANTPTPTIDQPGNYTLLVTNPASGCTATDLVEITANVQLPTIAIAPPMVLTCTQTTTTLSATATGTTLSYQWQTSDGQLVSGATSAMPLVDAPGTYSITVTDGSNGCTQTNSISVLEDITSPNVQAGLVGIITCIAPSQTISTQNLSLPGNFNYTWTATNGGNITSGNTTLTPTVDAGGDYTLITTNVTNGCTSTILVNVAENTTLPIASAGPDNTLSCNINSLIITGSGTGANNLTYAWTASNGGHLLSGANTPTPTIDQPGNYTLLVTNSANGCTATDVAQILNDNNTPQVNAGPPATLTCTLQQTTLHATASTGANLSYQWTTVGGQIVSGATTLAPTIDAPGVYQLAVTNAANGCVSMDTVTIGENVTLPSVDAGPPDTLTCATPTLPLAGTTSMANNLIFQWTTANGNIVSGANTLTPQVNRTGIYELTITNSANGCTNTDIVSVGIDTLHPSISASVGGPLNCQTLTTGLTGLVALPTGFTAAWTTNNGHFSGPQNMLGAIVDAPGIYQLTVQNTANGCSSTAQATVLQDVITPIALVQTPSQITCDHPTITLSGVGSSPGADFKYLWTASNGGQIQSGQMTLSPVVTAAGTYSLLVTSLVNGCEKTAITTVTANKTLPTVAIVLPQTLTCIRLSTVLNAGGSSAGTNFTNTWTATTTGHITAGQTTLLATVDQPGTYLLTIENTENGCTATAQTVVDRNITPPVANAGPDAELHCQQTEVTLQGSSTATNPVTFAWTTSNGHLQSGNTTANAVADQAGAYTLVVTSNSNGCTASDVAAITAIPLPAFLPTVWQPDCFDRTGDVDFGPVTGGTAPFRYSADGGLTFRTSPTFDDLSLGAHELVVEDQNGCIATQTADIQLPFVPTVTLTNVFTIQQGDSVQLLPILNLPLSSIATWQWTPTDGLSCVDCPKPWAKPLQTTTYALIISDLNGCTAAANTQFRVDRTRQLYAPNVFSPNGDGQNDHFLLYGKGVKEVREMRIFDRWGAELFLAEHMTIGQESSGWGGDFRGKGLNPAVFVWQAIVEFLDGKVEIFSGDVTLMR